MSKRITEWLPYGWTVVLQSVVSSLTNDLWLTLATEHFNQQVTHKINDHETTHLVKFVILSCKYSGQH